MSFWTNPVKAVTSWVRPVDAFLKAVLPAPVYALVITLLSNEAKVIGILAQAYAQDVWEGKMTIPELADKLAEVSKNTAKSTLMDIARAYTTPTK